MALMTKCSFAKTLLELQNPDQGMYATNHIFEPEFHQDIYVKACESGRIIPGAFQVGRADLLERPISRGTQPEYADDETDSKTLQYEGMVLCDGNRLHSGTEKLNVCVLKSNCIRNGYIDLSLARSTDQTFFAK